MRINNNIIWNTLVLQFMMQISTQGDSLRLFFPCWYLKLSLMLNSRFGLDNELRIHDSWLRFIYFISFFLFHLFIFI